MFDRFSVFVQFQTDESTISNATHLVLNWILSLDTNQTPISAFNISNVTEWFQIVVIPVMKKYLQTNQTLPSDVATISNFVL